MNFITRNADRANVIKLVLTILVIGGTSGVSAQDWQVISDPRTIMEEGYIQVVGGSEERQSRYRALRAATVVAQRDLLEVFQGLTIAGNTTISDGMLESDQIRSEVKGFLRGAVKCGQTYHSDRGFAEVCMRLYIRGKGGAYDIILPLLAKEGLIEKAIPDAPEFVPSEVPDLVPKVIEREPVAKPEPTGTKPQMPSAARVEVARPSELSNPQDGLMLEVDGMGFKPAIVNRIVTSKGDLVFGPSRVVNNVLVERGCGGFTNDLGKAKGLLATWDSNNPMQVKAVEVRRGTDVVIDTDDAAAVFTHDQKTSFLSQAKVVFVIK